MADCGPNCTCETCCTKPTSYVDNVVQERTPGIVMATPETFAELTFETFGPKRAYDPLQKFTTQELDDVIDAINTDVIARVVKPLDYNIETV